MTIQEVSGNPAWAINYYRRNEAVAYLRFMGIAHIVGVEHFTGVSILWPLIRQRQGYLSSLIRMYGSQVRT
jgi:hypothetical protein